MHKTDSLTCTRGDERQAASRGQWNPSLNVARGCVWPAKCAWGQIEQWYALCWCHTVPKLIPMETQIWKFGKSEVIIKKTLWNIVKISGHLWGHRKLQLYFYCIRINFGRFWEFFGMPRNYRRSCWRHLFMCPLGVNFGSVWRHHYWIDAVENLFWSHLVRTVNTFCSYPYVL